MSWPNGLESMFMRVSACSFANPLFNPLEPERPEEFILRPSLSGWLINRLSGSSRRSRGRSRRRGSSIGATGRM